jgi:PhzF family phenazine biosynthesis protein
MLGVGERAVAFCQVDAFTDRAFGGNPAGVCWLDGPAAEPGWLQTVADELNLPATAFVWPLGVGDGVGVGGGERFGVRWFSPTSELALCGHGTLATAHVLLERDLMPADGHLRFETQAGLLSARERDGWIELDFPAEPSQPVEAPPALVEVLGGAPFQTVERNRFDYLVELPSEAAVRTATPDLVSLSSVQTRGLILTARADTVAGDFVSRFFAPSVGIDEDAVTGSAHCCLGPYWQRRLGRSELVGVQLSRRGGVVRVQTGGERVRLAGQAVTVLRGELVGPAARHSLSAVGTRPAAERY